ncbi:LysR family transcriptional regulator [Roseovarius spongiae]|uniref:LysR family transcriptional regulator n=1 Tax=Roseovarius spongiae TaxID=2320272 RepID=A0A3A8B066_9RHOB|nr:LysR family transcriptional regulator [Roseovarius spongiae]RKF16790.1 LysR family transcriptional regulator [Roseovarius spongiae]
MPESPFGGVPLEWVRAFEAAGRTGSFTAAARDLKVTQAAVSQRIGALEARIGRPLFLRGARGIALTVDGETWLPYVSTALRDLGDSYDEIFGLRQDALTISASASVIELWLAPRLGRGGAGPRPQLVFSTRVLPGSARHQGAAVRIDYGTGEGPAHLGVPLFREALCPVAAPELTAGAKRWQDLPRIGLSGPRPGWQDWARFSGDPATPVPALRFDSFAAALAAAVAGEGVLLASLPLARAALGSGAVAPLARRPLEPPQTYWMQADRDAVGKTLWRRLCALFQER